MRKSRFSALLFLSGILPIGAHASPAVGDTVEYAVTTIHQGGAGQASTETVKVVAFDSATNQYQIEVTKTVAGSPPETSTTWKPTEVLVPGAVFSGVSRFCGMNEGVLETLETPAGTLQTCRRKLGPSGSLGKIWISNVPFGTVKLDSISSTGEVIKILTSYSFGQ